VHEYLAAFDVGARVEAFLGDRSIAGKYYYAADFKGFNFERRELKFLDALALMRDPPAPTGRTVYVGSVPLSVCMPGFAPAHRVSVLPANVPARIWLGHPSNVSSHYDAFDNLACVVAGQRRFTLYAPEHIAKLYMGPIDNTMAGPPVSLAASARRARRTGSRCSKRFVIRRWWPSSSPGMRCTCRSSGGTRWNPPRLST